MPELIDALRTALHGSYRIERELGGGGMSHVFLARETALERDVVIKVVRPELLEGVSAARFTREVQLAARLQQANIVPVLTAGEAGGTPFYTMPYVRGESLAHRLQANPTVPLAEALGILRDVARALAYAHQEGVVHRDIKPANVLLSGGTAVVTDFGIAKAISASRTAASRTGLTSVGTSLGTPAYMAPEQAAGDPDTDHRADLYAWGIMAWELVAGRHPFADRTTPQALMAAHLTEEVPPLGPLRSELPPGWSDLIARCLEKDPARRPADAGALLEALDALGSGTHRVPSASVFTPGRGAAAAVLLAAVVGGGWWLSTRGDATSAGDASTSIAVLPFADLSADRSGTYLGDGVAETLINALSTVPGLTVSGRASAFSFRDRGDDLRRIGQELGVATVLIGSIQQAGGQLRVAARVVRIADDSILWSRTFDRPAEDIFAVQDEVARAVATALGPGRAGGAGPAGKAGGTANPRAYDAYLLGRYHWNRRTTDGMIRAAEAFQRAIALDSGYAQAWSGLADTYSLSIPGEYNVPGVTAEVVLPLAEAAARRAMTLAPELGEGYVSLGQVMAAFNRQEDALAAYERGIALSPAYPTGRQWYSYTLQGAGRWDEAIAEMEAAHRLDPLAHVITLSLAVAYDGADRFEEAEPLYERGLEQSPQAWYGWRFRFANQLARGQYEAARASMRQALNDTGHPSYAAWRRLSQIWDDPAARLAAADGLVGEWEMDLGIPMVRWLRGEDAVAGYLTRMRDAGTRLPSGVGWAVNAFLGPRLRADPRVGALLRDMGMR